MTLLQGEEIFKERNQEVNFCFGKKIKVETTLACNLKEVASNWKSRIEGSGGRCP